jgi:tRNA threonylcarbamoyladenosine biosynthesis protein TsaE
MSSITTTTPRQTRYLGSKLARRLVTQKNQKGIVIGLTGDLGSGKTTFIKGMALGLKISARVISPTFVLMRCYRILSPSPLKNLYHIDAYRLSNPAEAGVLGLAELWSNPQNLLVIEWADKIKSTLPNWTRWISFSQIGDKKRKITL